jgi:hypothetical protein
MSRWILALASCSLLVLGIAGCSASDDDATAFDSGVDGKRDLGDLTPQERVTICSKQAAFVRARVDTSSLMRFVCAFTPEVLFAQSDSACETAMNRCVELLSVDIDVTVTDNNATETVCSTVPISQCQGTVADYENCVDSIADVQINIGTNFQCGKRQEYADGPTVGVNACAAVGPACTPAAAPVIR